LRGERRGPKCGVRQQANLKGASRAGFWFLPEENPKQVDTHLRFSTIKKHRAKWNKKKIRELLKIIATEFR